MIIKEYTGFLDEKDKENNKNKPAKKEQSKAPKKKSVKK